MNRKQYLIVAAFFVWMIAQAGTAKAQDWTLVWSDEFDGPAGSVPDPTKWNYDIGGNGWGNNELEYYTNRPENAFLDGQGNLVIKAIKEDYKGADRVKRGYTSARLLTQGKFSQRYGRIEARIRVPFGQGIWPAFWMLGNDVGAVGWPGCGEIDIMENIGREPSTAYGTIHGPGYSGGNSIGSSISLENGQHFSDDFHVFGIEWEPTAIRFYVDGKLYETRIPADLPSGGRWVYDHPFFILLNVAVGGGWPGNPDSTSIFPQTMTVDYVRVYKDSNSDFDHPVIDSATITGKNLVVIGHNFDGGAIILMNGKEQKTIHDGQAPTTLVGKKVGKKIKKLPAGESVLIQVKNSDGVLSSEFSVARP